MGTHRRVIANHWEGQTIFRISAYPVLRGRTLQGRMPYLVFWEVHKGKNTHNMDSMYTVRPQMRNWVHKENKGCFDLKSN